MGYMENPDKEGDKENKFYKGTIKTVHRLDR